MDYTIISVLAQLFVALASILTAYAATRAVNTALRSKSLEQRLQLLHRAREVVTQQHTAFVFLICTDYVNQVTGEQTVSVEVFHTRTSEEAAYSAELEGLALAVADEELLDIIHEIWLSGVTPPEATSLLDGFDLDLKKAEFRAQHLHKRISQLIEETKL